MVSVLRKDGFRRDARLAAHLLVSFVVSVVGVQGRSDLLPNSLEVVRVCSAERSPSLVSSNGDAPLSRVRRHTKDLRAKQQQEVQSALI